MGDWTALSVGNCAGEAAYGAVSGWVHSSNEGFLHPFPRAPGIWSIGDAANTQQSITRLHQSSQPDSIGVDEIPAKVRIRKFLNQCPSYLAR